MMRQRDIFKFWLPLFASWVFMLTEGPTVSAVINRLPNEVIMLAAQGIVVSLSVTIESPILNLLATATTLVKDRASYLLVRKFTIHWMLLLTAVSIIFSFTPLFDLVVIRWMGTPAEIVTWVRPGMKMMVLWSAAIAWRRFLQGVLIHFGRTRTVAWGTAVRLAASAGVVIALAFFSDWASIFIGTTALMAGVIAEALYATWAVRPLLANELSPTGAVAEGTPLTYSELFWFHLPLAATSLMILLAQPLITFSLARLDQPTNSLAAWPVLFQVQLMARAAAFALPEVVIALNKGREWLVPLRRFSLTMTAVTTLAIGIFTLTPAASFYLFVIQDMAPDVGALTLQSLPYFIFFPGLSVLASWLRGLLIGNKSTKVVNIGMGINLLVTAVTLTISLRLQLPGLTAAALALNLALLLEITYLSFRTQKAIHFKPLAPAFRAS